MKRILLLALLVAAAALVPDAAAKGQLSLCGSSGCNPLPQGFGWGSGIVTEVSLPPVPPSPYFSIQEEGTPIAYWSPAGHALRTVDIAGVAQWMNDSSVAAALAATAVALAPFPVPTSVLALVQHHSARHPASYLGLFSIGTPVLAAPRLVSWLPVLIFTTPASPWGDGADAIYISRSGDWLLRDREVVRISAALAHRIRNRLALP